jgi:hypothetical protein
MREAIKLEIVTWKEKHRGTETQRKWETRIKI